MAEDTKPDGGGTEIVQRVDPQAVAQAPPTTGDGGALIAMIERAARDPNVDIDKMERLFDMHQRVEGRRAEQEFNAAMAAAQAEIKPVARNLYNSQTKSKYADLAAVSGSADPIIHKHGLGVICSEFRSEIPDHIGIRCEVTHAGGFSRSYDFNIPVDGAGLKGNANKTATHAYGSTVTYGRRYAKCSVFDIATTNDTDGNAPVDDSPLSDVQLKRLEDLVEQTETEMTGFMEFAGFDRFDEIPASHFQKLERMLLLKLEKKFGKKEEKPDE